MQISSQQLLQFIGRSPSAPDVDAWLTAQRIHGRPHAAIDDEAYDEDADAAQRNARASEVDEVERFSLALIYEDAGNYLRLFGPHAGQGAADDGHFVLKQVAFYAPGVQGYRGFVGQLPFDLAFGASQDDCRRRLGAPWASRQIHALRSDLWLRDGWQINLSYLENDGLGIMHVRRWHRFDRQAKGLEAVIVDPHALEIEALRPMLGRAGDDAELATLLAPLGWDPGAVDLSTCDEVPDLIRHSGVTLYFDPPQGGSRQKDSQSPRATSVLSGFRLNRTGDMNSQGFAGVLPFGIRFCDTPHQAIERVGRRPDRDVPGDDVGAYLWRFPDHLLHVMYSLIDFQVYRVSCFLPRD